MNQASHALIEANSLTWGCGLGGQWTVRVRTFLGCLVLALVLVLGSSGPGNGGPADRDRARRRSPLRLRGPQCHYVEVAVRYVRGGAPDPSLPVLVLDSGGLQMNQALDDAFGAGGSAPGRDRPALGRVRERAHRHGSLQRHPDRLRFTWGGCDLNLPTPEGNETPDSDAINARAADIGAFFNAGGGIFAASGPRRRQRRDGPGHLLLVPPAPLGGAPVSAPFTLTDSRQGHRVRGLHKMGVGTHNDVNRCATHNSFTNPDPGSALQITEFDSEGKAETLFAEGVVVGGRSAHRGRSGCPTFRGRFSARR